MRQTCSVFQGLDSEILPLPGPPPPAGKGVPAGCGHQ